jgi:hypothetical protein
LFGPVGPVNAVHESLIETVFIFDVGVDSCIRFVHFAAATREEILSIGCFD